LDAGEEFPPGRAFSLKLSAHRRCEARPETGAGEGRRLATVVRRGGGGTVWAWA
jgi:hypothetical protein